MDHWWGPLFLGIRFAGKHVEEVGGVDNTGVGGLAKILRSATRVAASF
jgi:hypothetical protein